MNIKYAEFYITNVCNLSCNNCNRFNNFNFKGSQRWEDLRFTYEQWAKLLTFDRIAILGGEPFTNLDLQNWIIGIRKLWPDNELFVTTNGSKLKTSKHIIDTMKEHNAKLRISIHSMQLRNEIYSALDTILVKPIKKIVEYLPYQLDAWKESYNSIKADDWPSCNTPYDFVNLPEFIRKECDEVFNLSKEKFDLYEAAITLIDATGFTVEVTWYSKFHESSLKYEDGKFSLYKSNPDTAINICDQKFCHAFKDGKLYKCGVAHALPEALEQFKIPVDDEQQKLLNEYQPAEVTWDIAKLEAYVDNLKNAQPISMCAFCPESFNSHPLGNVSKKKY
jgi:organic radical activating enzyme